MDRLDLRAFRGEIRVAAAVTSRVVTIRGPAGGRKPNGASASAERPEAARARTRGKRAARGRAIRAGPERLASKPRAGAPTVAIARRLGLASPAREASSARKCLGRMPRLRSGETRGFARATARATFLLASSRASCYRGEDARGGRSFTIRNLRTRRWSCCSIGCAGPRVLPRTRRAATFYRRGGRPNP